MSNQLSKRLENLEQKAGGPVLLVVWDEMEPDIYHAEGTDYSSLEAVKEAYPGRDITLLQIVYVEGATR